MSTSKRASLYQEHPNCPSCRAPLYEPNASQCTECSFSLEVANQYYTYAAPKLSPILDTHQILTAKETKQALTCFQNIKARYPQIEFTLCLVNLDPEEDLNVFGFWLLNQTPHETLEELEHIIHTCLILIDHAGPRFSISKGIAIDPLLPDGQLKSRCKDVFELFKRKDYQGGFNALEKKILTTLDQAKAHEETFIKKN